MLNISVCMITKNEEKHLPATLNAIKDYGFEIVIVDTGSTDKTIEIARKYTDNIYHFDWINDFSAARNFSLSKASNDWILVLDADEIITNLNINKLIAISTFPIQCIGTITRRNHFKSNGTDSVYVDKVNRFINRNATQYTGSIHEQPYPIKSFQIPSIGISHDTEIQCEHHGYIGTIEEQLAKNKRNEELLLKELIDNPDDPYIYFQLGQCFNGFDDAKALMYYSKGLTYDIDPSLEYVQMMVIAYGYCLLHLEKYDDALELISIYDEFATSADFITLVGLIYMRTGNYIKAMTEFLKATCCEISHNEGANSYIPLYNMGCINELLGEKESAISLYKKCGDYPLALGRLKELQE